MIRGHNLKASSRLEHGDRRFKKNYEARRSAHDQHYHDDVLATLYQRFDNLTVYIQGKNIVPYRLSLRQCKLANIEITNIVSPTLNTIEDIDPFYLDISFIFCREQLAPLPLQRITKSLPNFTSLASSADHEIFWNVLKISYWFRLRTLTPNQSLDT